MNSKLYCSLDKAYDFLLKDETEYLSHIRQLDDEIKNLCVIKKPRPKSPDELLKKDRLTEILLLVFVWPVGLWYICRNRKMRKDLERKANEQYVRETNEYNRHIEKIKHEINIKKEKLEDVKNERRIFYTNYGNCLTFIPEIYRTKDAVEVMRRVVKLGLADSLKEALNLYIEGLKEIEMERVRKAEEERRELRHMQTQEALKNIAENQEKTAKELEKTKDILNASYNRYFNSRF